MNIGHKKIILLGTVTIAVCAMFFLAPISQDPTYHMFADQREMLGVPNFLNVVSNIPFVLFGLVGLVILVSGEPKGIEPDLIVAYMLFFSGVFLIGFGSSYYHLAPGNDRLIWDRLPMALAFMAFFSLIVGENVTTELGKRLLLPMTCVGMLSVIYWAYSESVGHGDLRPYALVQFLPAALIPMILWMFSSRFTGRRYIWIMLGLYALSKLMESADQPLFELTGFLSGHSVKHLTASAAALIFLLAVLHRKPIPASGG
jgi:hypothetical protein